MWSRLRLLALSSTQAKEILEQHHDQLEIVTKDLLDKETLDAQAFNRLIGRSPEPGKEQPDRPLELAPPV